MPENKVPVSLSEQAHWKNREGQTQKPSVPMGPMGHAILTLVVLGLAAGGYYGFRTYRDYMNGSKEMALLDYHYFGETTPSSAHEVIFQVPTRDTGDEVLLGERIVNMPVLKLSVGIRADGKNVTTLLLTKRREYSPDYDVYWEQALILVPSLKDYEAWSAELDRIRGIYAERTHSSEGEKYQSRRILPPHYKEPEPELAPKSDDSY